MSPVAGGLLAQGGHIYINDTNFTSNAASNFAAQAIYNYHDAYNYAVGGALSLQSSSELEHDTYGDIERVHFIDNEAHAPGGTAGGAGVFVSCINSNRYYLLLNESNFEGNFAIGSKAALGGALLVWEGSAYALVFGSNFSYNTVSGAARNEGGALYRWEDDNQGGIYMYNETRFKGNQASLVAIQGNKACSDEAACKQNSTRGVPGVEGHTLKIEGGRAMYVLPGPPGHFVYGIKCEVSRRPCLFHMGTLEKDANCMSIRDTCARTRDENNVVPSFNGTQCTQLIAGSQKCDWQPPPSPPSPPPGASGTDVAVETLEQKATNYLTQSTAACVNAVWLR